MEALEAAEGEKTTFLSERKELQENIFLTAVKRRSNVEKQVGAGRSFAPSNS